MTSATLTVENSTQYIKDRLGLSARGEEERIVARDLVLLSPFDYKKQVYLGIFKNMPEPTDRRYEDALKDLMREAIDITGGKAFALFTSYKLLDRMENELRPSLICKGIMSMKQGDQARHTLLKNFKKDTNSVLFGTDSFWEGVDVRGESLSNVLITKLPFRVPNDPILKARADIITARGGNSFMDYFLPQAVIRFKQGFGRLIRDKSDRGSVLIFDSRLVTKRYGARFMNSLPNCECVCGHSDQVLSGLRNFFNT